MGCGKGLSEDITLEKNFKDEYVGPKGEDV